MTRITAKERKAKELYWNEYLKECEEEMKKQKQIEQMAQKEVK